MPKTPKVTVCVACSHPVNKHTRHRARYSRKLGCQHLIPCSGKYIGENDAYCNCLLGPKECKLDEWDRKRYEEFVKKEKIVMDE